MPPEVLPVRHSPRLSGHDYSSPGAYFITLCTERKRCVLGSVHNDVVVLNPLGTLVRDTWRDMESRCRGVTVDVFEVMPNHIHAIVFLSLLEDSQAPASTAGNLNCPSSGLPNMVRRFKTFTTTQAARDTSLCDSLSRRGTLWQRSYYDHVIRNDSSLQRIRDYIVTNPLRWSLDRENPECMTPGQVNSTESYIR